MRQFLDGVLVIDKPRGPTSHDVVAEARRLYRTRAVGHAGTLDPMATGVLVLLFGEATKLSAFATREDKSYRAVVRFGQATETDDADGKTIRERALTAGELKAELLAQAVSEEKARCMQVPPPFSAIKVAGRRAHRLSRAGVAVELEPRPVTVRALNVILHDETSVVLELRVSKGYYVRSLARDLGDRLGIPAHLAELRRLASGAFSLEDAVAWPLAAPVQLLELEKAARRVLPVFELTPTGEAAARQGKALTDVDFVAPELATTAVSTMAWLAPKGGLVALGQRASDGSFKVVRGFRG